ncbi:MAG: MAPEG family protein [Alphaproteobacteria bacterium]|nr:MAPEG family protein [Alphaproteobacteria bacterium]
MDLTAMNMQAYAYPGFVSGLALLVYYFTLFRAGIARVKFKIPAPSHEGPEEYVRHVRAHHNTMEHLVMYLPGMWLFAFAVDPYWAAGLGAIWPVGRLFYALGYYKAAEKRRLPLYITMPPIYIFILGSIIGFGIKLFQG